MPLYHNPSTEAWTATQPAIGPNGNSFLGDVFTSEAPIEQQMSAGFYEQRTGTPLQYHYDYDEMKVITYLSPEVEHFYISDEEGKKVDAKQFDVFYFKKGCTITFEVVGKEGAYVKNFFTGLRPADAA